MMSLETIIAVNEEIAARAAGRRLEPFVPGTVNGVDAWPSFPFPNLGFYEPPDWERTETEWFIDKSGRGAEWEPALTVGQFKTRLREHIAEHPSHGFGIVEEGPFQAKIAAFRPVDDLRSNRIHEHPIQGSAA